MAYYYINPADYTDPEPPPPPGRCVGFEKGCGRFVANGGTFCPRCKAEAEQCAKADEWENKRIDQAIAEESAYWDAYWKSPEGRAEIEADRKRQAEYEAEFDDLPY